MQVQEILTAAIVFLPVAYAALIAVQFATGLAELGRRSIAPVTAPIAADEPETPAGERTFIPNLDQPAYNDADRALVDAATLAIADYWRAVPTHNVVPFTHPHIRTQKPQEAHPAFSGMTLRAMRQLGAELRIKGARRWNTERAIEVLSRHYGAAA